MRRPNPCHKASPRSQRRSLVAHVEKMAHVPSDWASRYRSAVGQADASQSTPRSARVRLGVGDGLKRPGAGEGGTK